MKKRTVELIKKLSTVTYPISIEKLANDFQVSSRTIHNCLFEANEYFHLLGLPAIETVRKKGVLLKLSLTEKQLVFESLLKEEELYLNRKERMIDLLLDMAFSSEAVFLNKKEEEYLISKSTMDEDMRRLRADILKYGLEIVTITKQGAVIKGPERSIRTMLFDVINQTIGLLDLGQTEEASLSLEKRIFYQYIAKEDIKKVVRLIQQCFPFFEDDLYKSQILLFSMIWVKRVWKRELIIASSDQKEQELDTLVNETACFIKRLCRTFDLQSSESELHYLQFILETLNPRDKSNGIEWVNAQLLSIQLIQFVEEQTKIPFTKKEEVLCETLYKHIEAMIKRLKNKVQIVNPISESIKKNYSLIYQAVKDYIPTLEAVIDEKISSDEIAFLVIHFSTIATSLGQDLFIYKSVVVCNHGVATGNLLAANLKRYHPEIEIVAVLSSQELSLIQKLDVDLVFSTYSIAYKEKPVLVIDPFVTKESHVIQHFLASNEQYKRIENNLSDATTFFQQILQLVETSGGVVNGQIYQQFVQLFEKQHFAIKTKELQPMLKDILMDNHILIKETASTWQEAIVLSAKPLIKENVIENRYVDAMIDSVEEYGPYIVIGKHLALAHARPENGVNKLGLSVATLAEPVKFDNSDLEPVKIIFCLAAVDAYSHLNIMKELIKLINDESKLEQLIAAEDKRAFKELLFDKT